jgi:hypothetical protein
LDLFDGPNALFRVIRSGSRFPLEKKWDCATVGAMKEPIRKVGWIFCIAVVITSPKAIWSQDASTVDKLTLVRAVMCETIQEYAPAQPAVVFSIKLGRVSCFTEFDPVPKQTFINHKWYRRDNLITEKRLTLNPPRWASFTSVQLRDADKGPWRIEVTDENDNLMHTLRFSITD